MRISDRNWMQVERLLAGEDRAVLPLGCTEQHAWLSLATDSILAERVAVEAAELVLRLASRLGLEALLLDAEQVLLDAGSRQADLWGANYYPGRGREDCIEFTSLINIRPAAGNRGMELRDEALRARVREITFALVGEGEPL